MAVTGGTAHDVTCNEWDLTEFCPSDEFLVIFWMERRKMLGVRGRGSVVEPQSHVDV